MSERIVKKIELDVPISRVWKAISDHNEFGKWFRVKLDGPFEVGVVSTGKITHPGYEHYPWRAIVECIEHERLLAFRWHDFDENSSLDVSEQPLTRVEFLLEEIPGGTRLTITESGFEAISDPRRIEVLRNNTKGWNLQAEHITTHVTTFQ